MAFIRDRFFWLYLESTVRSFIENCSKFNKHKSENNTSRAELYPIINKERFEFWEIDYTGPLPTTQKGNRFIMVCLDHFSKWAEAVAIPDITAKKTAQALFSSVICRFGIPKYILSDQGTAFES